MKSFPFSAFIYLFSIYSFICQYGLMDASFIEWVVVCYHFLNWGMIYLQWNTHILIQSVLTYVYIPNQKIGQPVPILIHKVSPYLTRRSPFKVAPVSFEMSPLFFEHFLTFWHKMFQILLVLCLPNFEISHFSKDSWFLLTWDGI